MYTPLSVMDYINRLCALAFALEYPAAFLVVPSEIKQALKLGRYFCATYKGRYLYVPIYCSLKFTKKNPLGTKSTSFSPGFYTTVPYSRCRKGMERDYPGLPCPL